jgi:hypothetical protein
MRNSQAVRRTAIRLAGYITLVIVAAATVAASRQQATTSETYLISKSGIGKIRLEMTLDEARRALPAATFARTSDGDGAALVEVTVAAGSTMVLWADEADPAAAIDWSKKIQRIETFSPAFHTAEGIRPGALVTDAEKVFGRTTEVNKSEIEQREFITFDRQPAYLTFRLDYTGIFQGESRRTKVFQPRAKILSIAVSSQRPADVGMPVASAEVETFVREALRDRLAAGDIPDIQVARPAGAKRFYVRAEVRALLIRITSRALPSIPDTEWTLVTSTEAQEIANRTGQRVPFIVVDRVQIEQSKGTIWLGAGLAAPPGSIVMCCCEREAHFNRRDGRWVFERWGSGFSCA